MDNMPDTSNSYSQLVPNAVVVVFSHDFGLFHLIRRLGLSDVPRSGWKPCKSGHMATKITGNALG
jgi:hypothetical protein